MGLSQSSRALYFLLTRLNKDGHGWLIKSPGAFELL